MNLIIPTFTPYVEFVMRFRELLFGTFIFRSCIIICIIMFVLELWLIDISAGRGTVADRTSGSQSRQPGFESSSVVSKLCQFRSSHVAPVHSAVQMSTWLQTEVDICEQIVFAQYFQRGSTLPRDCEMALE